MEKPTLTTQRPAADIGALASARLAAEDRLMLEAELNHLRERVAAYEHEIRSIRDDSTQNTERLDLLLRTSADCLWDWDMIANSLYLSARWKEIAGYDTLDVVNANRYWWDIIHPDDRIEVTHALNAHLRNEKNRFEAEYRIQREDGEFRWIHSRGIAQIDEAGKAYRMVGSHRDVGERKRLQEEIDRDARRFRAMIENGSDIITLINADGIVTYQSPSITRLLGYAPDEVLGASFYNLVHPNELKRATETLAKAFFLEADATLTLQVRVRKKDGNYRWIEVIGSNQLSEPNQIEIVLNSRDITDLKEQVDERTQELKTLVDINQAVSGTLDTAKLLQLILDQVGALVEYDKVNLFRLDEANQRLLLLEHRGNHSKLELDVLASWKLTAMDMRIIETRKPEIVGDIYADTPNSVAAKNTSNERIGEIPSSLGSWMGVPIISRDRVVGLMSFDHHQRGFYTEERAKLAMAFASQVAIAMENARLYAAERQRLEAAMEMSELVRMLNSEKSESEILVAVLRQVNDSMSADAGAIYVLDDESRHLVLQHALRLPNEFAAGLSISLDNSALSKSVLGNEVLVDSLEPNSAKELERFAARLFKTRLTIPLATEKKQIGCVELYFRENQPFDDERMSLATTIGNQCALGIQNAQLRTERERSAIVHERSRIARELHDSVSQALFSVALTMRAARTYLDIDPLRAVEPLDFALPLAEGALAEMRALILELRPESLQTDGLVTVMQKQVDALCARYKIDVSLEHNGEPPISLHAKEALYRISQESCMNTVKHAQATRIQIKLNQRFAYDGYSENDANAPQQDCVVLEVIDNGKGFDITQPTPGHLGLTSMRERAEKLGGTFVLSSTLNAGTRIVTTLPIAGNEQNGSTSNR
jgi:PAS domain S-box-containing protein